ncbi:hypothetical protein HZS_8000, partial [Henneguya salminicola]
MACSQTIPSSYWNLVNLYNGYFAEYIFRKKISFTCLQNICDCL